MHVCVHTCVYACVHVYTYVCIRAYVCMHVCTRVCTYVHVCMYARVYIHMCMCMHTCVYTRVCVNTCVHVCVYVCVCVCLLSPIFLHYGLSQVMSTVPVRSTALFAHPIYHSPPLLSPHPHCPPPAPRLLCPALRPPVSPASPACAPRRRGSGGPCVS